MSATTIFHLTVNPASNPGDNPGGDNPGGDNPGGDNPGGDNPGGDNPGGDNPGGNNPGGDNPGGDNPGGDNPGGDNPGGDNPGGDNPGGDNPGGDNPGGDNPGGDNPGGDNPGGDNPGGDNPGGDNPGGDNPGGDNPGGDNPGGDNPGGDNPGGDNPGGDNPGGDNPGGDNPGGDNPGGDNPGGDNPGGNSGGNTGNNGDNENTGDDSGNSGNNSGNNGNNGDNTGSDGENGNNSQTGDNTGKETGNETGDNPGDNSGNKPVNTDPNSKSTISVPDTGRFLNSKVGTSINSINNPLPFIIFGFLIIAPIVALLILRKKTDLGFKLKTYSRPIIAACAAFVLLLVAGGVFLSSVVPNNSVKASNNEGLSITADAETVFSIESGKTDITCSRIVVNEATSYGYQLTLDASQLTGEAGIFDGVWKYFVQRESLFVGEDELDPNANYFKSVPTQSTIIFNTEGDHSDAGEKIAICYAIQAGELIGDFAAELTYTVEPAPNTPPDDPPVDPGEPGFPEPTDAYLVGGPTFNVKLKNLANGTTDADNLTVDTMVKAFRRADSLPAGFIASEENTISLSNSTPIYIFFDNTDNAGIMYYYSTAYTIIANANSEYMFEDLNVLSDISGLSDWDTSNVVDLHDAFARTGITNVDAIADWNVASVKWMSGLFTGASALSDISGLSDWKTDRVISLGDAFSFTAITNVDALSGWNVASVQNMHQIFGCNHNLSDISGIANWNTGSVTTLASAFAYTGITNVDALSGWNVENVTDMSRLFERDYSLTDISGIQGWDVRNVLANENFYYMFSQVPAPGIESFSFTLRPGHVVELGTYIPSDGSSAYLMDGFTINTKLKNLANNTTDANAGSIYTDDTMIKAFRRADSLPAGFIASEENTISLSNSTPIYIFFDNTNNAGIMYYYSSSDAIIAYRSSHNAFYRLKNLSDISGLLNWDVHNVENMSYMFSETAITNTNALANWNVGNVQNMEGLFDNVTELTDISGLALWDTHNVQSMANIFYETAITNLNALTAGKNDNSNVWNVSNVVNMYGAFRFCRQLDDISGIRNWDVRSVKPQNQYNNGFEYMFQNVNASAGFEFDLRPGGVRGVDGTYIPID